MASCQDDKNATASCDAFYSVEEWWSSISQTSSVWDLLSGESSQDAVLTKKKEHTLPNPCPYVRFTDLNNHYEGDAHNKPKSAVEIGLKFTF